MRKLESYEQLRSLMSEIRSLKNGYVTNFYWDENKHPYWIEKEELFYKELEGCVILVHKNETFFNLFFIAVNYETVTSTINSINLDSPQVLDLVCRGDGRNERDVFRRIGFKDYRYLYRMSHVGPMASPDWSIDDDVKCGCVDDSLAVSEVFRRDFDPLCEQLPSLAEINDFAERKQMLIIKDDEKLCGVLIFESTGVTWYLRYWYTAPEYRNKGVGAKLLRTALVLGKDTKRQLFWVISDNDNAIKRYEHYGFKREDMNDYVIIKR